MLHNYECEKCGSVCYIESEVWESCPICEETFTERKLRRRAEFAEQALGEVKNESSTLRRQRESYKKERDELRNALQLISSGTTADILGLTSMSKQDMQSIARRALEGND